MTSSASTPERLRAIRAREQIKHEDSSSRIEQLDAEPPPQHAPTTEKD